MTDLRFCTRDDVPRVMEFLGLQFGSGHVLSHNRDLFEWQHSGTWGREYDFAAAFDGDRVVGSLGFILASRFDSGIRHADTLWLTTWAAAKHAQRGLGLLLLRFVQGGTTSSAIGTVGNTTEVGVLYRALGYSTGTMRQHYVLHPALDEFRLATVPAGSARHAVAPGSRALRVLSRDDLPAAEAEIARTVDEVRVPWKSGGYFASRYLDHPFYRYRIYGIMDGERVLGLLAGRTAMAEESSALRLVDFWGPDAALSGVAGALQGLLEESGAEFADLVEHGLEPEALAASGMVTLDPAGPVVIPSYFEPFVRRNIVLNWAYRCPPERRVVTFKADADQDRPSRIHGAGS